MAEQLMVAGVGHYLGTIVDGKWWKRYRGINFFARGKGEYILDLEHRELRFRRYLTKKPIVLPLPAIEQITMSASHGGKWLMGREAVILHWHHEGQPLASGFLLPASDQERVLYCLQAQVALRSQILV